MNPVAYPDLRLVIRAGEMLKRHDLCMSVNPGFPANVDAFGRRDGPGADDVRAEADMQAAHPLLELPYTPDGWPKHGSGEFEQLIHTHRREYQL